MDDEEDGLSDELRAAALAMRKQRPKGALLSVVDVRAVLGVADRKAREIMLALPHVRVGRLLKIRPEVLDRWQQRGGDTYTWPTSTQSKEPDSSGAGASTLPDNDGTSRRSRPTRRQPGLPRVTSSADTLLIPVGKRKASSRSG